MWRRSEAFVSIGMGLHVSTLTESSSGPQDTDPCNNVSVTCVPQKRTLPGNA